MPTESQNILIKQCFACGQFMRPRYESDSYAVNKARRLKRIERRACRELQQAYQSERLSLRQYDLISRRPARQQHRIIAAERARNAAALIAADTIEKLLDSLGTGTPLCLREVVSAVTNAVRGLKA
jgi:hypothetical protein